MTIAIFAPVHFLLLFSFSSCSHYLSTLVLQITGYLFAYCFSATLVLCFFYLVLFLASSPIFILLLGYVNTTCMVEKMLTFCLLLLSACIWMVWCGMAWQWQKLKSRKKAEENLKETKVILIKYEAFALCEGSLKIQTIKCISKEYDQRKISQILKVSRWFVI